MSAVSKLPERVERPWLQLAARRALRIVLGAGLMLSAYLLLQALGIVELPVVHAGRF